MELRSRASFKNNIFLGLGLFFLVLVFLIPQALAAGFKCDASQGKTEVTFEAIGRPSLLTIHGTSDKGSSGVLSFNGQELTGTAAFRLDTLETGISTRDHHMKDKYLEVEKFPEAKLEIQSLKLLSSFLSGDGEVKGETFRGTLTLHGVPKSISGVANATRKGKELELELNYEVNLSDYKIDVPSFAGITIKDNIKVKTTSHLPIE